MENTHDENRCILCSRAGAPVDTITGLHNCFSAETRDGDICCTNFVPLPGTEATKK